MKRSSRVIHRVYEAVFGVVWRTRPSPHKRGKHATLVPLTFLGYIESLTLRGVYMFNPRFQLVEAISVPI